MAKYKRKKLISAISYELRQFQSQTDQLDEATAEVFQVNRTDHRCIDLLERAGAMTAGELAGASGLTTGAITAVLDRLEKRNYAERSRDTGDRRRVLVKLTAKAQKLGEEIWGPPEHDYARQVEPYTTDELALIYDFMRRGKEFSTKRLQRMGELTPTTNAQSKE
jgi:DNA-binding MarR family transcriptional regulator